MASIQGILNPSPETAIPELEQNALMNEPVVAPTTGDWLNSKFKDTIQNNPTYLLGAMASGRDSQKYSPEQLQVLYPDTPTDFWKGGANAFQAEMLYDKHKQQMKTAEMEKFILGENPNLINRGSAWTLGTAVELAGGLTDPLTLAAFGQAGRAAEILSQPLAKVAPAFMNYVAKSRLATGIAHEVAINVMGETAVMYPLRKTLLDDYTKGEETTLSGTVTNAIGTALAFAGLKYVGSTVWRKAFASNAGAEFTEKVNQDNFSKAKDKANAHVNSEAANEAAFQEAAAHTVQAEMNEPPSSVSERMSAKAFEGNRPPKFNVGDHQYWGLFEKNSGKSDYVGERFGDTHVFVSSAEAAQGMFDTLAKDGNNYSIYGHQGGLHMLDLESEIIMDHPDVLDIIEHPMNMGKSFLDKIKDESTLAEVFRAVNNSAEENGMSGKDVVDMFNKINEVFKADGYEATTHFEQHGKTRHEVMSVFDSAMDPDHIDNIHEGVSDSPITPTPEEDTNPRTTKDVELDDGSTTPIVDDIPPDDFYDMDEQYTAETEKWESPEFKETPHVTDDVPEIVTNVQDKITELSDDLKYSMQTAEAIKEPSAEYLKLQEKIDKVQEDFKNNSPEQEKEVSKAIENCIRKHT